MNNEPILAFTGLAGITIMSPGPAILLALRNSLTFGLRSVIWSSLGNVSGIFCLSAAAMLGLGVLLMSSALLFGAVKLFGALYWFYIGFRHLLGRPSVVNQNNAKPENDGMPSPLFLYREAFLLATTNAKPIVFFTALFPQFINAKVSLLLQFFIFTGIFMGLSLVTSD
jgi:threonine/homoserine/homoserine lactone efflux protein